MLKTFLKQIVMVARRNSKRQRLEVAIAAGLPPVLIPALNSLIDGNVDSEAQAAIKKIERSRAEIAAQGDKNVAILYSPRPGTAGETASENLRPHHGEIVEFTMKQVAATGKSQKWGTFMHLLAKEAKSKTFLELGACAGISSSYLGSTPDCESLITIEGSAALAELARSTLSKNVRNAQVVNALFNDALDELLPTIEAIDFLFIDGHHERVATIHYWLRVAPKLAKGAIVVFDDISWSQDMRDGWDFLSRQADFSHAIDLGGIGVCIYSPGEREAPAYFDLRDISDVRRIQKPHGWKNEPKLESQAASAMGQTHLSEEGVAQH